MHEYRAASILAFTEMWLNENDNDDMLHIDGFSTPLCLDRVSELTDKHLRKHKLVFHSRCKRKNVQR